jgi:hypothetical protein
MNLPKQDNLPLARKLSVEALGRSNLRERALKSGAQYEPGPDGRARVGLKYLNRDLWLSFPAGGIEASGGDEPLSFREEILIFHYLERAKGGGLAGEWISFGNIAAGVFYHSVFLKRCKEPLVKIFGGCPEGLPSIAGILQGEPIPLGDVGVRISAFPFVPLALVLWRGDEDFSPEGNILFDGSVTEFLPVEDIVILAETVIWKLIKTGERLKAQGPRLKVRGK